MGVIDSLSAGYRFLGRRWELLLIPVILDLFLWWGPQLSLESIFQQLSGLYAQVANTDGLPTDMAAVVTQASALIEEAGTGSNLAEVLAMGGAYLHLPSLVTTPDGGAVFPITDWMVALGLALFLAVLGALLGITYLSLLARYLPIGHGPNTMTWSEFLRSVARNWLLYLLFVLLTIAILAVVYVPASLGMVLLSLVNPALGSLAVLLLAGLTLIFFFYLYFVPAGLIMDSLPLDRAIVQSFHLVRKRFWATLGFYIVTNLIALGFALILIRIVDLQPWGTLGAILVNAYIGTGLAMALLVFYRTQLVRLSEETLMLKRNR